MQWTAGVPDSNWDDALFAANGHFLQSSHWAAFQSALGNKVFHAAGHNWQAMAILEPSRTGTRLYCPYGPLATGKGAFQEALRALRQLGREQKAVFARMEPIAPFKEAELRDLKLKPALKDMQPHLTWVQDLTKSEDELLAELTATNRNLYRTHANKGLSLRASRVPTDMPLFIELMRGVAKHNAILPHPDRYYQTMADILLSRGAATLYIAEHEGKTVATAFCFDSPTTRYYAHAAADFEARKLHPGTPLVVQMMLDAKQAGQTTFDFVGVAPADAPPTHRWAGFTRFKQSFGGDYKPYLGTWEMALKQPHYLVYRTAYKARKALAR
jgi:lipid II:glycine glycyltransferase (peptidoglycan interpeptide bridge formation enzyme)